MKTGDKNHSDFGNKVLEGLKIAHKRMIQEKIAKDQSVVIMHKGKMITIKAAELSKL